MNRESRLSTGVGICSGSFSILPETAKNTEAVEMFYCEYYPLSNSS